MSIKDFAPTYHTRRVHVLKEAGRPKRLLNAGCGDGVYNHYLKNSVGQIISFDINRFDLQMAKEMWSAPGSFYFVGDISCLPLKSHTFDCIICTEVLEHLKDDVPAIRELSRVLRTKGKLIITVPSKDFPVCYDPVNFILNRFGKKLKIGAWAWGHERLYSIAELRDRVSLRLVKWKLLSGPLVGLLENGYLNSLLQRFTKNDPKNRTALTRRSGNVYRAAQYHVPYYLERFRDLLIRADRFLFPSINSHSIGLFMVFEKQKPLPT